jgi:flavin-dependent dehydrogenase
VNRKNYDMQLVELARGNNCIFKFAERVINLDINRNTIVTDSNRVLFGRIIVGADGVNSIIRRIILPEINFKHDLAVAYQKRIPAEMINDTFRKSSPILFFGNTKHGYSWIFPNNKSYLVGMGGLIRKNENYKKQFKIFLGQVATSLISPDSFEKHLVPFGNFLETPGKKRVLLIGDAAGFVDPFIGEGIYYAHKSAEHASEAIVSFLENNGKGNLIENYQKKLLPIYKELMLSKRFRNLAYISALRFIAYAILRDSRYFYKFAKIIHGIKSYSRIPLLSVGIKP